jgi:ankyrin repeat protein
VTEYRLPRALTRAEITALVEYTKGQWSDGIGEGCFDDYSKQTGINVSAFPIPYDDDAVQIQVIDDGVLAAKRSPLFSAAKKGDTKRLRALLDKGEDIEAKGQWQHTPLMWALSHQQIEAVLLLISRGANVNYKTKDGATCIRLATMYGNVPVLAALINAGANVNETDERGATPVMWAANRGFLEALQLLLDHGADVDAQDTLQGHTALMYASPNRLDIVEHLLRRGANPRARSKAGLTAHEEALQQAKWEQSRPDRAKLWEKKAQLLATDER